MAGAEGGWRSGDSSRRRASASGNAGGGGEGGGGGGGGEGGGGATSKGTLTSFSTLTSGSAARMVIPTAPMLTCASVYWKLHPAFDALLAATLAAAPADSVALLHATVAIWAQHREQIVVAHVNHGLRGDCSDDDAEFVRGLASQFGLSFKLLAVRRSR